jgi:hypothetical protein
VHLRQQYKGLALYDASETVRFDTDGRLIEFAGRSFSIAEDLPVALVIGPTAAVEAAATYLANSENESITDQFGESFVEPVPDPATLAINISARR